LPDGTSKIFFVRGLDRFSLASADLPDGQITVHHLAAQGGQKRVAPCPTFEDEKHVPLV